MLVPTAARRTGSPRAGATGHYESEDMGVGIKLTSSARTLNKLLKVLKHLISLLVLEQISASGYVCYKFI